MLITEFHLILAAIGKATSGIFWRLIGGTTGMLVAGYMGEAGYVGVWPAFIVSMAFWFAVLYEIFVGEASKAATTNAPASVQSAYKMWPPWSYWRSVPPRSSASRCSSA